MTITVPASNKNIPTPGVAFRPASSIAMWDPEIAHRGTAHNAGVRTLRCSSLDAPAFDRSAANAEAAASLGKRKDPRAHGSHFADRAGAYLVGGFFGLALLVGAIITGGGEDEVIPTSTSGMGYSVSSLSR